MNDSELLQLCGLPADSPEDLVELVRLAAKLLERGARNSKERDAAAVLVAAAMGRAGGWSVQSLPFGYEGPRIRHDGWIKREDLECTLTQLGGLIAGSDFDAVQADYAISQAIGAHWLREKRHDAWRPGMARGSGWTTVVEALPLGLARARELATAEPKPAALTPWRAPSPAAKPVWQRKPTPPTPPASAPAPTSTNPGKSYTVAAVLEMAGVSDTTLNRYAKLAGIKTPERGKRNHRYSADEVRAMLQAIIDNTSDRAMKERCAAALAKL